MRIDFARDDGNFEEHSNDVERPFETGLEAKLVGVCSPFLILCIIGDKSTRWWNLSMDEKPLTKASLMGYFGVPLDKKIFGESSALGVFFLGMFHLVGWIK